MSEQKKTYEFSQTASPEALSVARRPPKSLNKLLLQGQTPDIEDLVGWTFCGTNAPDWAKLVGIKKFIKGFEARPDGAYGYNCPTKQTDLHSPWEAKPSNLSPKKFGFYTVSPVEPQSRDNHVLHSVLLDYSKGGNPWYDPTQGLRDYLVQVYPGNPNLFLGKAYYRVGPLAVSTSFFVLSRRSKA